MPIPSFITNPQPGRGGTGAPPGPTVGPLSRSPGPAPTPATAGPGADVPLMHVADTPPPAFAPPRPGAPVVDERTSDELSSIAFATAVIVGVALALRILLLGLGPAAEPSRALVGPDAARYVALGEHLLGSATFGVRDDQLGEVEAEFVAARVALGEAPPTSDAGVRPETRLLPGYAALVGVTVGWGLPLWVLLVVQCVIGALTAGLVYHLALGVLGRQTPAALAGMAMAVHPTAVTAACMVSPAVLAVALVVTGLWLAQASWGSRPHRLLAAGLVIGAAGLTWAGAVVLGPVVALWLTLRDRSRSATGWGLVVALVAVSLPGLWVARNAWVAGDAVLSHQSAYDRYYETATRTRLTATGGDPVAGWTETAKAMTDELRWDRAEGENAWATMARLGSKQRTVSRRSWREQQSASAWAGLVGHGVGELYGVLGIGYRDPQVREHLAAGLWSGGAARDRATYGLAVGWTALNAAVLLLGVWGVSRLLVQRRAATAGLVLGLIGGAVWAWPMRPEGGSWALPLTLGIVLAGTAALLPAPPRPRRVRKPRPAKIDDYRDADEDAPVRSLAPLTFSAPPKSPGRPI